MNVLEVKHQSGLVYNTTGLSVEQITDKFDHKNDPIILISAVLTRKSEEVIILNTRGGVVLEVMHTGNKPPKVVLMDWDESINDTETVSNHYSKNILESSKWNHLPITGYIEHFDIHDVFISVCGVCGEESVIDMERGSEFCPEAYIGDFDVDGICKSCQDKYAKYDKDDCCYVVDLAKIDFTKLPKSPLPTVLNQFLSTVDRNKNS